MKHPFLIFSALILVISSCKKTDDPSAGTSEIETTFELSRSQAIADKLTEDVNDVYLEAVAENNLMGARVSGPAETLNTLSCATVNVTPLTGFPKTITLDFGTGCTSPNGVTRSGIITIVISDSIRRPGTTSVMTFSNFFVNGFQKEGIITWTNTSIPGRKSWRREVTDGKITAPGGGYWLHESLRDVIHSAGVQTPRILLDDEFMITGSSTVTNPAGRTREATIITPLHKAVVCHNVDAGSIRFEGPNHYSLLDFGNGTCDREATISIDGNPPRTILL